MRFSLHFSTYWHVYIGCWISHINSWFRFTYSVFLQFFWFFREVLWLYTSHIFCKTTYCVRLYKTNCSANWTFKILTWRNIQIYISLWTFWSERLALIELSSKIYQSYFGKLFQKCKRSTCCMCSFSYSFFKYQHKYWSANINSLFSPISNLLNNNQNTIQVCQQLTLGGFLTHGKQPSLSTFSHTPLSLPQPLINDFSMSFLI